MNCKIAKNPAWSPRRNDLRTRRQARRGVGRDNVDPERLKYVVERGRIGLRQVLKAFLVIRSSHAGSRVDGGKRFSSVALLGDFFPETVDSLLFSSLLWSDMSEANLLPHRKIRQIKKTSMYSIILSKKYHLLMSNIKKV